MFEIEKDVPLSQKRFGRAARFPFAAMEVGDSFLVPLDGKTPSAVQSSVSGSVSYAKRRYGAKYATSQVEGGVRVWRIE